MQREKSHDESKPDRLSMQAKGVPRANLRLCLSVRGSVRGVIVAAALTVVVLAAAGAAHAQSRVQDNISQHFALPSPVEFEDMRIRPGIDGIPVLEDALVSLECRLRHAYEGGDHTIFVGEVEAATIRDGSPLVYFHGNYRDLLPS